ncbi:hypothetical protein Vafri_13089 [Volvox africanus]|uniref:Uncharacterized protein n=1 Tax=Volvox africanus TaxID=51714 RepID=A0A8J4F372_9CHLO|nr:hypothetical protein Vafri_13089 [Volvox africanus]
MPPPHRCHYQRAVPHSFIPRMSNSALSLPAKSSAIFSSSQSASHRGTASSSLALCHSTGQGEWNKRASVGDATDWDVLRWALEGKSNERDLILQEGGILKTKMDVEVLGLK